MPKEELEKIIEHLRNELAKLRAGRASIDMVENIEVEVYDSKMPLNQLATLSSPEPRLILISPWDKNIIKNIESALRGAMNDVSPVVDSESIRLSFPAPTEDKRKELVKEVGKTVEEAKIKMRRVREDALQDLKSQEDRGEISEDELFRKRDEVQGTIDEYSGKIEEIGQKKETEVMSI